MPFIFSTFNVLSSLEMAVASVVIYIRMEFKTFPACFQMLAVWKVIWTMKFTSKLPTCFI